MVLQESQTRYLLVGCLVMFALLALAVSVIAGNESAPSGSEERLRELLTERYDILKNRLASMELFLENGRVELADYRSAVVTLHHAEAELCATDADRVKVYERLVEAMQTQVDWATRRADAGRIAEWELAGARFAMIEAQIDLECARLGRHTPK